MDIKDYARKIEELVDEVENYRNYQKRIATALTSLEIKYRSNVISPLEYKKSASRYLQGRDKDDVLKEYDDRIRKNLGQIKQINSEIYRLFTNLENDRQDKVKIPIDVPRPREENASTLDKKEKMQYLDEMQITHRDIKEFVTRHEEKKEKGVSLKEKIAGKIPKELMPFEKDLKATHNLI